MIEGGFLSLHTLGLPQLHSKEMPPSLDRLEERNDELFSFGEMLGAASVDNDAAAALGVGAPSPAETILAEPMPTQAIPADSGSAEAMLAEQALETATKQPTVPAGNEVKPPATAMPLAAEITIQPAAAAMSEHATRPQAPVPVLSNKEGLPQGNQPGDGDMPSLPEAKAASSPDKNAAPVLSGSRTEQLLQSTGGEASRQGIVALEEALSGPVERSTPAILQEDVVKHTQAPKPIAVDVESASPDRLSKPTPEVQRLAQATESATSIPLDKQPAASRPALTLPTDFEPVATSGNRVVTPSQEPLADPVRSGLRDAIVEATPIRPQNAAADPVTTPKTASAPEPFVTQPREIVADPTRTVQPHPASRPVTPRDTAGMRFVEPAVPTTARFGETTTPVAAVVVAPDAKPTGTEAPVTNSRFPTPQPHEALRAPATPVEESAQAVDKTDEAKADLPKADAKSRPVQSIMEASLSRPLPASMIQAAPSVMTMATSATRPVAAQDPQVQHSVRLQVLDESLRILSLGKGEAELQIDPPELGKVRMRLTLENQTVRGWVEVENASVRAALMADMGGLVASLTEMGLDTAQFEITLSEDRRSRDSRNRRGHEQEPQDLEEDNVDDVVSETPVRRSRNGSGVDYLL